MYQEPHDHRRYGHGHWLRVETTKLVVRGITDNYTVGSVADLSCGNAEIALSIDNPAPVAFLGDFAPGYEFTGPLEQSVWQIPQVDLFICSETIEHLDAPHQALGAIRLKADRLVLSTPVGTNRPGGDDNAEHLWCWDREGVESLLCAAGWTPELFCSVDTRPMETYNYGIWSCT